MDSESEKQLFSCLLSIGNEKSEPITDYPRLNKNLVHQVSKNIAKIVYDSIRNETASNKLNRDAIIGLLSKWSRNNNENHLNINEQNRDVVIKYLNGIQNEEFDPLLDQFLKEALAKHHQINLWDEIFSTFENIHKQDVEIEDSRELIRALDRKKVNLGDCIASLQSKSIQKNDFEKSFKSILGKDSYKSEVTNTSVKASIHQNNDSVALGYALLNMSRRNKENQRLFTKIFNELIEKLELSNKEMEFLKYLWVNARQLSLPEDISKRIINSCSFLYEKPLLEIASHLMVNESTNYDDIFKESGLSNIFSSIRENKSLYYNVKNCLYELYTLSNYNVRIKDLLLYFNSTY